MTRIHRLLAVITAGALVLAGCSSSDPGTPTAATTAAGTTSAATSETAAAESEPSGSESSADETSAAETSQGQASAAAELDAETAIWFSAFCTGLEPAADFSESDFAPATAADVPAAISAVTTVGTAFSETAQTLGELPAPTFPGGEEVATAVVATLDSGGDRFAQAATEYGAIPADDTAGLKAAGDKLIADLDALSAPFDEVADLPADVNAGVEALPACQWLSG